MLEVISPTKPTNVERPLVVVVMGLSVRRPTYFARLGGEIAVAFGVGDARVGLSSLRGILGERHREIVLIH